MVLSNSDSERSLNILVISSQLPYPPDNGTAVRMYHLYRRLRKRHHLTWVCPVWPEKEIYIQEVERYCNKFVELPQADRRPFPDRGWRYLLFRMVARLHWERLFLFCFGYVQAPGLSWLPASAERLTFINKLVMSLNFDLIVCETEGVAELVPTDVEVPKVIALHNAQSTLFRRIREVYETSWEDRLFFWPELLKIMWYERSNYSRFNLGVTVSEADRQLLKKRCPDLPVELIPNGVDISKSQPVTMSKTSRSLVYFGNYGYAPNVDAIFYFCNEILPLIREKITDVQLFVVGKQPPEGLSQYEGVQVVGFVSDVSACVAQADVVVAPLRVGGGTRLKIIEALALGKAVVSTTVGAEGLNVTHGQDILLADEPETFADVVVRLLEQPDLRARLGKNGRKLMEEQYNWDILAAKLSDVFQKVVNDYHLARSNSLRVPALSLGEESARS